MAVKKQDEFRNREVKFPKTCQNKRKKNLLQKALEKSVTAKKKSGWAHH